MWVHRNQMKQKRISRGVGVCLALILGGSLVLSGIGLSTFPNHAEAVVPSTFQATAFRIEPDLTGATVLQGTTSAGTAGSNGYYSLSCGTDLTTSTASTGSATPVAPEIENNALQYAVWAQNTIPTQANPNATFFSDSTKSGRQMRVQSITCVDGTATENNGYSYIVHAAPFNATSQQDNVIIRAKAEEIRTHLALLYLNSANTISVPITINTPSDVATTVTGVSYNSVTKKATFGKKSNGTYTTQLTVTVPRDYHIEVVNGSGSVVSSVSIDNSTTANTIQTLDVTAALSDRTTGLTVRAVKTTGAALYMPRYSAPQDSYTNYGRVRKLAVTNDNATWTDYRHVCELYRYDSFAYLLNTVKTSTGGTPNAYDNCGGFDFDYWGQYRNRKVWDNGFPQSNSSSWKTTASVNSTANSDLNAKAYKSDGTVLALPTSVAYGGTVEWTVDNVPQRVWNGDSEPLNSRTDMPNAFLANVRVNDQDLFVPFPQPWIDPSNTSGNTGFEWGRNGNGFWNQGGKEGKKKYSCARGWMLGIARGTDWQSWCTMDPGDDGPSVTLDGNRRLLTSYTFTHGANAGMTVQVYLKNVRYAGDRLSLSNYRVAKEVTISGSDDGSSKVGENDATDTDIRAMNMWRTRYEIVISGIKTTDLKVETSFDWNTHSRLFLANGVGVRASSDATRTSVQVHGHLNGADDAGYNGMNRWINLCDGGSSTSMNSGTGATTQPNNCSYMWENLTSSNPMKIRAVSPNGYGAATLTSPQNSNLVSAGVYDSTDDYLHYDATQASGRTYMASGFTQYANTIYPLLGYAGALDFPVKYMSADGTTMLSGTNNWPAVFNVNAATRYSFDVANLIPDTGNKAFNSWKLEGWKSGTKVGTVLTGIEPGSSVDIRELKFLDGDKSGKRALTNGGGQAQIDELRLVPDTTSTATGERAGIYPVTRTIQGAGANNTDVKDTVWYYRAVPGMHAELATSYRTSDSVKKISYTPSGSTTAKDYSINASNSTFGVINLATDVNSPALLLYYGQNGAKVKFSKTVQNNTGFTWQVPTANNFALRLTKSDNANMIYTISNGQTTTSEIPNGTYNITEVKGTNSTDAILQTWKPATSRSLASGFSCKYDGETQEQVNQQNKQITISGSSKVLNCAVTNYSAVIGIVTYDAISKSYIDAPSTGAEYGYAFVPLNSSDNALTSGGWIEKSDPDRSSGFLTPNVSYKLQISKKPFAAYTTIQKFTGTKAEFNAHKNDPGYWSDASLDNFTLQPDEYNIYRVVTSRYVPILPSTGGIGQDQIILGGIAALIIGFLGALVIKRWRATTA